MTLSSGAFVPLAGREPVNNGTGVGAGKTGIVSTVGLRQSPGPPEIIKQKRLR
jgi:hypothetical protein